MKVPDLLIDRVYRETFRRPRDPELREVLGRARRCILSDEAAAFLYTMMVELILQPSSMPTEFKSDAQRHRWHQRLYGRLDDCRHFSRLPHPAVWVEYRLAAMAAQERKTKDEMGWGDDVHDPAGEHSRVGWLMEQHPAIGDRAVSVRYVVSAVRGGRSATVCYPVAVTWCTDDTPLPWPSMLEDSDTVVAVPGYRRRNVGLRALRPLAGWAGGDFDVESLTGRCRMMWAFLATFNKIPILGEQRVVPSHGFVARGAYHRFLEHKVLTINIPEKAGLRKIARQVIGIIRRRAHQVRGHWRDDWHGPKGNKALWIAEHQRGDASIGFVTHDYNIAHKEA